MKPQIRILGIDDCHFDKSKEKETTVIGVLFRGGDFLDGVLACKVKIDGNDATRKITGMVNNSKFLPQIRAIMLDGIAVAGFNVIDVQILHKKTSLPVIIIMRAYPNIKK